MKKTIPFDIKYRPQIENGEMKVETEGGTPVEILKWDADKNYPIIVCIQGCAYNYTEKGVCVGAKSNLVLVSTEQESEDERIRKEIYFFLKAEFDEFGGEVVKPEYSRVQKWFAWLEKQKEQKPISQEDFDKAKHEALYGEQKPTRSEEDEKMRNRIIDILNRTFSVYSALGTSSTRPSCPTYKDEIAWLKSLRPHLSDEEIKKISSEEYTKGFNDCLLGKQKGWSEEDEHRLKLIRQCIVSCPSISGVDGNEVELLEFLDSLRPSWKPSEEQMKALHNFAYTIFLVDGDCEALRSLYEDLKKTFTIKI